MASVEGGREGWTSTPYPTIEASLGSRHVQPTVSGSRGEALAVLEAFVRTLEMRPEARLDLRQCSASRAFWLSGSGNYRFARRCSCKKSLHLTHSLALLFLWTFFVDSLASTNAGLTA